MAEVVGTAKEKVLKISQFWNHYVDAHSKYSCLKSPLHVRPDITWHTVGGAQISIGIGRVGLNGASGPESTEPDGEFGWR